MLPTTHSFRFFRKSRLNKQVSGLGLVWGWWDFFFWQTGWWDFCSLQFTFSFAPNFLFFILFNCIFGNLFWHNHKNDPLFHNLTFRSLTNNCYLDRVKDWGSSTNLSIVDEICLDAWIKLLACYCTISFYFLKVYWYSNLNWLICLCCF
jgi:hypothetical protein